MKQMSPDQLPAAALEHERLTSLIGSMADGVIAVDDHMKVVLYNGAALNILDLNASVKNRRLNRILTLYDKTGQAIDAENLVHEARIATSSRDLLLHYADGSTANVYLSIAPVHLGDGSPGERGSVLLLRDISREKSLEEERDEFISVISHELRTPIAITEGNISNALFIAEKNPDDSKAVQDALQAAHDQVLFLAGLVNDLSTLSRAERGVLKVEPADINVYTLLQELAHNYTEEASVKGLKLYSQPDDHLEVLRSSELYVREILQNFITNAIKYTQTGSVTIGAKPIANGVIFTVQDSGIGISKSDQEKVFDKFFRSEDYRTRENSGTGLGLYVTMKLARLIKADIKLESELNKGSTFIITIPNLK